MTTISHYPRNSDDLADMHIFFRFSFQNSFAHGTSHLLLLDTAIDHLNIRPCTYTARLILANFALMLTGRFPIYINRLEIMSFLYKTAFANLAHAIVILSTITFSCNVLPHMRMLFRHFSLAYVAVTIAIIIYAFIRARVVATRVFARMGTVTIRLVVMRMLFRHFSLAYVALTIAIIIYAVIRASIGATRLFASMGTVTIRLVVMLMLRRLGLRLRLADLTIPFFCILILFPDMGMHFIAFTTLMEPSIHPYPLMLTLLVVRQCSSSADAEHHNYQKH
ncbi:MAG: hypothetical protein ACI4AL_10585, partial [Aristaeellaceae bacterium]